MSRFVRVSGIGLVTAVTVLFGIAPASATDDGVSAVDLETGKEAIFANEATRMWECWEDGPGSAPRLYQRVGKKWKLLDVATMQRDESRCGSRTPIKATYEFTLQPVGTFNVAGKYYVARVMTKCTGCESYQWKIRYKNNDLRF